MRLGRRMILPVGGGGGGLRLIRTTILLFSAAGGTGLRLIRTLAVDISKESLDVHLYPDGEAIASRTIAKASQSK